MFDLIDESGRELKGSEFRVKRGFRYGICRAEIDIDSEEKSENLSLNQGKHYIFNSPLLHLSGEENEIYLARLLANALKRMLKEKGYSSSQKVLIACLGNPDIEADRLGKEVFDGTNELCQGNSRLFKFCPNICLFTGLESAKIIKLLVDGIKIDFVLIIDALTTSSLSRLGRSFQLVDGGMTPGSGVNRFGKAIDEKFLEAKCISIGVPFMINSRTIVQDEEEIFLVPKDVSEDVARAGRVVSDAIGQALK